jgi:two-component system, NarL family, response regulator DesR
MTADTPGWSAPSAHESPGEEPAAGGLCRLRVLVAEDTYLRSDALAALVREEAGADVVAHATTGHAVLDVDLLGVDACNVIERLRALRPDCKIIAMTGVANPGHLRRALAANVTGLIVKSAPAGDLLHAIGRARGGDRVIDHRLALAALDATPNPLAPQETEILRRYAEGHDIAEIATQVFLSDGTVRNYLRSAAQKLGARNRAHAILIAVKAGWI